MLVLITIMIIFFLWMAYEIWRAPMMDEDTGEIIEQTKKLSDLFKRNKK
jgi:uncharacterized membrane protein (DUF106 family)